MNPKAAVLRSLLAGHEEPLLVIGAHDGLGARIAEEVGFDAIWASGLEISASAGVLDAGILGMSDMLEAAVEINHATRLPVICDCDSGFGNAIHVAHLVKRYEAAGIAAVCIEDQQLPKMNSFAPGSRKLVSVEEFTDKIRAASDARSHPAFTIIARVEALIAGLGIDEALDRASAYVDAGADAILFHSKQEKPDEILEVVERWKRRSPVFLVPTTYHSVTATRLGEAGASAVIYANHGIRATIQALGEVLPEIVRNKSTQAVESRIAGLDRVFQLQGIAELERLERPRPPVRARVRGVVPASASASERSGSGSLELQIAALEEVGADEVVVVGEWADGGRVRSYPGVAGGTLANLHAVLREPCDPVTSLVFSGGGVVDSLALRDLLDAESPISILVHPADHDRKRVVKGAPLVVECDSKPPDPPRSATRSPRHRALAIGQTSRTANPRFEFAGVSAFTASGSKLFLEACQRYSHRYADRRFGGSVSFAAASLHDFLEVYLADGGSVLAIESSSAASPGPWRLERHRDPGRRGGMVG